MSPKKDAGFSDEERAAMQERARELKVARADSAKVEGESAVQAKIAEMEEPDRGMAARLHALILSAAPGLAPRLWYGMPAYALDGKVICFFQSAQKFKTRYCTLGFSDAARLDDGAIWPTSYALTALTAVVEERITALIRQAVG